jgi:predicted GTPase
MAPPLNSTLFYNMAHSEFEYLDLLAEFQDLEHAIAQWRDHLPDFPAAGQLRTLVDRLLDRVGQLRLRIESPLVVATLGGTGTGKSSLVNALVGSEVATPGRQRPTTRIPTLICRPDISPEQLGISPDKVQLVHRDLPMLRDLVLLDCPDPDTTEDPSESGSNLARLHELLPHCDVLLVTTTQQKYRSFRVAEELAAAASGARLVFVQTHADQDDDIREDWRRVLDAHYNVGEMFYVDCLSALADARQGVYQGEFARLVEHLTRELSGTAAKRIRRANFVDLLQETLARCQQRCQEWLPAVQRLQLALQEQRHRLAQSLVRRLQQELTADRREWERRLLSELAARWGSSPFAWVLRAYLGLGGLVWWAALLRSRSPAQMILWGSVEAGRVWRRRHRARRAAEAGARISQLAWGKHELREAATIVAGYARDAGMRRVPSWAQGDTHLEGLQAEAAAAVEAFSGRAAQDVSRLVERMVDANRGWLLRGPLELLLVAMVGLLGFRLARNFFYESWLATPRQPVLGLDFYVTAGLWLVVWCGLLVWLLSAWLRRGLKRRVNELSEGWAREHHLGLLFAAHEEYCRTVQGSVQELERLQARVEELRQQLEVPPRLGHRYPVPAASG